MKNKSRLNKVSDIQWGTYNQTISMPSWPLSSFISISEPSSFLNIFWNIYFKNVYWNPVPVNLLHIESIMQRFTCALYHDAAVALGSLHEICVSAFFVFISKGDYKDMCSLKATPINVHCPIRPRTYASAAFRRHKSL